MSDYIDTREGWREITDERPADAERRLIELDPDGHILRGWVREAPVPPLPTEPHTVIRAWWGTELYSVLTLDEEGTWRSQLKSEYDAEDLAQMVRFEVLSEPRAVTAKAILQRVGDMNRLSDDDLGLLAREFGVTDE